MEPLRKALRLPRVSLFIADDTGLGKTIEAGLIARELLLRKKAKTIVVAVPPSVLEQWKAELEERFGLVFEILDRQYFARMRRERGFGVNPWRTHSRFLVSHNLLDDGTYADPMREWLAMLPGSPLILDEAHHAAQVADATASRRNSARRARPHLPFEHRLFLSATPHNGHSNSFSTLLELLDPYRFTRGVKVRGKKALEDVMVRRLKEDIREVLGDPQAHVERSPLRACLPMRELVCHAARRVPHGREERFATPRAERKRPRASLSSAFSSGSSPPSKPSRAA
jgi:SNF2 family DNA or RNA helicase